MKHDNPQIEVGPLFNRITLHVPDEYLRDSFKTRESQDAMYDLISEKFMQFKNNLMCDLAEMQSKEADVMAKEKAEQITRQMSAYLNAGLPEEKAWELVKMEVARDAQDA
jgi:hypothetical protein